MSLPTDHEEDDRSDRALWRRYREAADPRPDSPCPDPNALAAYVDGRASPEEVARLEEHLAACAACFEILADVRAGLDAVAPEVPADSTSAARALVPGAKPGGRLVGRGAFRRVGWWAAAAAVVAAVSFAGYRLGSDTPDVGLPGFALSEGTLTVVDPMAFRGPGS
jgi:anti-sigma factor RsiW